MGVPDDFAWVVMWGALADLLGENGPAADPLRAQYADQRWQDGIAMAKGATTIIQAQVNNVQLQTVSLFESDGLDPNWQNNSGSPVNVLMAGLNLVAVSPVPDGVYSMTLDIVQNAPVPLVSGTQVLVGRDVADALLDYAQHVQRVQTEVARSSPIRSQFTSASCGWPTCTASAWEHRREIIRP